MARILLQADDADTVLLDERDVRPEHMHDEHSTRQLLERLGWALRDEGGPAARSAIELPSQSALRRSFD